MIIDGISNTEYIGDIGINKDKIVAIGKLRSEAKKVIDATNLIVSPGFIDVHTHCDLTFKQNFNFQNPDRIPSECKNNTNFQYQGVTTVVTGNCGLGFSDTNYWLNLADSINFGSNVYHLIPYGSIREEMFGENQPYQLKKKELELLQYRIVEEMEKGAIGISTGLEYAPCCFASTNELIEIAKVVKKYNGIYATHLRSETGMRTGNCGIIEAIKEAVEICEKAEIPIEISHLKLGKPFGNVNIQQVFGLIENARSKGLDVTADQYPYDAGSTMLSFLLPDKFKSNSGIKNEYKTKKGNKILENCLTDIFSEIDTNKLIISSYPEKEYLEGLSISKIALIQKKSIIDCYIDMLCENIIPWGIFFLTNQDDVDEIAKQSFVYTVSDGWTISKNMQKPHPRLYGSFPRKIKNFVLEKKLLSLSSAIKSMSSLPAEKFKIKKRGKIKINYFADISIIDLNKIKDNATYLNPHQYSDGIEYLFINGNLIIGNNVK